ncbi:MAG TPA: four-carbon acid sugar kinase family protein [Propionibacteriaceae bacterium]|nr:four-carbon acid sugar kinase family protein [Propionibacteriaceae bacterium]
MGTPLVLADDLSGAAETAAALGAHLRPELFLWPDVPTALSGRPIVVDLDTRHLPPADAEARTRAAVEALPSAAPLFKKIDSLLRGNIGAEVAPLAEAGALVVVTPALPQQGRTVVDGVLLDHGVPLDRTGLWALEPTLPPPRVAGVLGRLPISEIRLDAVRGPGLAEALAAAAGTVVVCDAETQRDLAAITDAGLRADPHVRFVGSSALARALAPHLTQPSEPAPVAPPRRPRGGVLYVLGTGSEAALRQADLLRERAAATGFTLPAPDLARLTPELAGELGRQLASPLGNRSMVVQVTRSSEVVPGSAVVAGLAALVTSAVAAAPGWPVRLVLSGGQTARAVLDALGRPGLTLVEEIHPGAVLMATDAGWLVATRPGSHGGPDSLWSIHQAMYTPFTEPGDTHE